MSDFSCDNAGNTQAADLNATVTVAATGQLLNSETDATITVEAGKRYVVTALVGYVLLGILTTATAANIMWCAADGQTIQIKVPVGTTSLHYRAVGTTPIAYLREVADKGAM